VSLTVYGNLVPVGGVGAAGWGRNGSQIVNGTKDGNGSQTVSGNQTADGNLTVSGNQIASGSQPADGNLTVNGKGTGNGAVVTFQGDGMRGKEVTWLGLLLGAMGLVFSGS
jgi:hypothetical protein